MKGETMKKSQGRWSTLGLLLAFALAIAGWLMPATAQAKEHVPTIVYNPDFKYFDKGEVKYIDKGDVIDATYKDVHINNTDRSVTHVCIAESVPMHYPENYTEIWWDGYTLPKGYYYQALERYYNGYYRFVTF